MRRWPGHLAERACEDRLTMWTLRKHDILASLVLAAAIAPAWSDTMDREQLEPSASILLRDAAAELCANTSRADGGGATSLSPAASGRLQRAQAVFRSLGYGQAPGTADLGQELRDLPAGPECRAQALSKFWQHFTSPGQRSAEPSSDASNSTGTDPIAVPGVGSPARPPGAAAKRKATAPEAPGEAASPATQATPATAGALRGAEPARGTFAVPEPQGAGVPVATAPEVPVIPPLRGDSEPQSPRAPSAMPREGRAAKAAATSTATSSIGPAPSAAGRMTIIGGYWPWLATVLVLPVAVLGRLWLRRTKRITNAQRARERLRPT